MGLSDVMQGGLVDDLEEAQKLKYASRKAKKNYNTSRKGGNLRNNANLGTEADDDEDATAEQLQAEQTLKLNSVFTDPPEETPETVPEETPETIPEDTPETVPEETPEDAP